MYDKSQFRRVVMEINRLIMKGHVVRVNYDKIRITRAYIGMNCIVVRDDFKKYHEVFGDFEVDGKPFQLDE